MESLHQIAQLFDRNHSFDTTHLGGDGWDTPGAATIAAESMMRYRSASAPPRRKIGLYRGTAKAIYWCGSHSSQIATLVERQSRYVMLVKVASKDAETFANTLIKNARKRSCWLLEGHARSSTR